MKIGILTFHKAHNYGAVLQAYALQTIIQNMGHEVSFVDYKIPFMLNGYNWFHGTRSIIRKNIYKGFVNLLHLPRQKKRYDLFEKFISEKLILNHGGIDKLDSIYDLIIIGSDQVWNVNLYKDFNVPYWGVFPSYSKKIISYAASYEHLVINDNVADFIKTALKRFSSISVREENARKQLQAYTDKPIKVCLDPTLLLKRDFWSSILNNNTYCKDYVFYYQVRNSTAVLKLAKTFARKHNCKLIVLSAWNTDYSSKEAFCSGPMEFLSWIKNAKYVISTSFHCTVFSLIFNKPFIPIALNDGWDNRVYSLLSVFGLENRIISPTGEISIGDFDWERINDKLNSIPESSLRYLQENVC